MRVGVGGKVWDEWIAALSLLDVGLLDAQSSVLHGGAPPSRFQVDWDMVAVTPTVSVAVTPTVSGGLGRVGCGMVCVGGGPPSIHYPCTSCGPGLFLDLGDLPTLKNIFWALGFVLTNKICTSGLCF